MNEIINLTGKLWIIISCYRNVSFVENSFSRFEDAMENCAKRQFVENLNENSFVIFTVIEFL